MRISDWSSDVCSSDLSDPTLRRRPVRGIAMTASVVRLRRSAFSYLLGFGLLVAASFLAFGAVTAPAWGQSTETPAAGPTGGRSEEHTSEFQSLMRISYAVFCLKKKKQISDDKMKTVVLVYT